MDNIIGTIMAIIIGDFAAIMTILAIIIGIFLSVRRKYVPASDIFLSYLMLLAVGLSGLWGFIFHAFFPTFTAHFIGWQNSPFQFEVAVANLGMGVAGIFGFSASRGYRIATTVFTTCFLWGAAVGHVIQMMKVGNFAPGNAGTIFYNDIFLPVLLIFFLIRQKNKGF